MQLNQAQNNKTDQKFKKGYCFEFLKNRACHQTKIIYTGHSTVHTDKKLYKYLHKNCAYSDNLTQNSAFFLFYPPYKAKQFTNNYSGILFAENCLGDLSKNN